MARPGIDRQRSHEGRTPTGVFGWNGDNPFQSPEHTQFRQEAGLQNAGNAGGGGGFPFGGGGETMPLGGVAPSNYVSGAVAGTEAEVLGGGVPWWQSLLQGSGARSLGPLIAALASGGGSGSEGLNLPFLERAYEDARAQNAMQQARYRRVDPLHEAVTQLALSRLPTASRQGITLNRVPLPGGGG